MNLYDLTQAWIDIQHLDIDEQDMTAALDAVNGDIDEKLIAISKVVRNINAEADAVKAEIDRLSKRKGSLERKAESLKEYARNAMLLTGKTNVSDSVSGFRIQPNPAKVEVVQIDAVPHEFCKCVPEQWVPDKNAIGQALKAGASVPGCTLVQEDGIRLK